jgi:hypothetical protein
MILRKQPDGSEHMAIGLLTLIVGGGLNLLGYASGGPGFVLIGVIVAGALDFLYGLTVYLSNPAVPRVVDPFKTATADFGALLRTMVAAAEHSGGLDEAKVGLIRSILNRVYGKDHDFAAVVNACRARWGEEEDIVSHLLDVQSELPLEFRRTILRASALILGVRHALNTTQAELEGREFLVYISRALQLPDEEFADNIAKTDQLAAATPQLQPL